MEAPEIVRSTVTGAFLHSVARPFVKGRVLDVGCGSKPYKRLFEDIEWVGLDARPVGDVQAMAEQMPFEDGEFDTVVCTDMLNYVPSPERVMAECARVLKPDGFLVVVAGNTMPEDGERLWGIGMRGLDFLLASCGMEGVAALSEGATVGAEWQSLANYEKYSLMIPADVTGWLDLMGKRYPGVSCMVGHKPCPK